MERDSMEVTGEMTCNRGVGEKRHRARRLEAGGWWEEAGG